MKRGLLAALYVALFAAGAFYVRSTYLLREVWSLRARLQTAEAALAQCVTPIVVATPAPNIEPAVMPCPKCRPCARRTRPAASDAWIERITGELRLCEGTPGR